MLHCTKADGLDLGVYKPPVCILFFSALKTFPLPVAASFKMPEDLSEPGRTCALSMIAEAP
jgi:hypothetical protein